MDLKPSKIGGVVLDFRKHPIPIKIILLKFAKYVIYLQICYTGWKSGFLNKYSFIDLEMKTTKELKEYKLKNGEELEDLDNAFDADQNAELLKRNGKPMLHVFYVIGYVKPEDDEHIYMLVTTCITKPFEKPKKAENENVEKPENAGKAGKAEKAEKEEEKEADGYTSWGWMGKGFIKMRTADAGVYDFNTQVYHLEIIEPDARSDVTSLNK